MNTIQLKTLAQLVNDDHRYAFVFEKYNLDFCCRGKRTLQQACIESKLAVDEVAKELQALNDSTYPKLTVQDLSVTELADYIVQKHHAYVKNEGPVIKGFLHKIASKHGARHPELIELAAAYNELTAEMEVHMGKEEQEVFPLLKSVDYTKNQNARGGESQDLSMPITMMEDDHNHAGELLEKIRTLTSNFTPPADACTTYKLAFAALHAFKIDLHQHVHLENNILFPKAVQLLRRKSGQMN